MAHEPLNEGAVAGAAREEDRRSDPRYRAVHWIARLTNGDSQELCIVRNVCANALIAQIFSPQAPGDRVTFELKDGRSLEGEIVWCGGDTVEVRLDTPFDLATAAAPGAAADTSVGAGAAQRMRISCGATLEVGGRQFEVGVRDLSQGGAKIETAALPKLGEPAVLEVEGLGRLDGAVRWCEGGYVGLAFDQPLAFDEMSGWVIARERSAEGAPPSRRWPRYNMFLKSWIQLSGVHTPVEIYIHNLSRGGLMATCRRGLHPGEKVVVGLGRAGEVEGSVAWTDRDHAGVAFDRVVDPDHARQPFANRSVPPILHHTASGRRPGLKMH